MDLLPASSGAWTAVANAQSREPSSAGQSQTNLPGPNSQVPSAELAQALSRLPTAFTLAESTVSVSRSTRLLSFFRLTKRARQASPSPTGRGSDEREREHETSFSIRSGQTASTRPLPTRVPTANTDKAGKTKGSKFSCRSLSIIPSFIGNLGCHGLMIR